MREEIKSVYHFNGSWFDIFDMLVGIIKPSNAQQISIWESRQKTEGHLLIVYGGLLSEDWLQRNQVRKITEPEFRINYKPKLKDHIIHGYNEFAKK